MNFTALPILGAGGCHSADDIWDVGLNCVAISMTLLWARGESSSATPSIFNGRNATSPSSIVNTPHFDLREVEDVFDDRKEREPGIGEWFSA